jgi:carbonic anhydrase
MVPGTISAEMIAAQTPTNETEQLTMDLEIEFRNELNERRLLPQRRHYFDFGGWCWIPVVSQKDDWA